MQRIINIADQVVEDMLKGFVKAHSDIVSATENKRVIKYSNAPVSGKVGIVTGGGSGHKPAFYRLCGEKSVRCGGGRRNFLIPFGTGFLRCF